MRILFLLLLIAKCSLSFAQKDVIRETLCSGISDDDTTRLRELFLQEMEQNVLFEEDFLSNKEQLLQKIGNNFKGAGEYLPECYLAFSYFPELFNNKVEVKYKKISATMNARPNLWNLFKKKVDRKYLLIINNNKGRHKGLELEDITFNARVGWLGHEFAHLLTYHQMSNCQTLAFAFKYFISNRFIRKTERYTNFLAIQRGLIFQIYQGEQFILLNTSLADKYRLRTIYRSLSYKEYICLWYMFRNQSHFKAGYSH